LVVLLNLLPWQMVNSETHREGLVYGDSMNNRILFVDDEDHILKALKRLLFDEPYVCSLFTSPRKALTELLDLQPALIVADQRMPEMQGTDFLEKAEKLLPRAVRVIMTGYADIDAVIQAINRGHIFRFIKKPWDDAGLKLALKQGLDHFQNIESMPDCVDRAALAALVERERLQGMLEMTGAVCHEFSQPLQIISGYCELLQESAISKSETGDQKKYVSGILDGAEKLDVLLSKLRKITTYKTLSYMGGAKIIDIHGSE